MPQFACWLILYHRTRFVFSKHLPRRDFGFALLASPLSATGVNRGQRWTLVFVLSLLLASRYCRCYCVLVILLVLVFGFWHCHCCFLFILFVARYCCCYCFSIYSSGSVICFLTLSLLLLFVYFCLFVFRYSCCCCFSWFSSFFFFVLLYVVRSCRCCLCFFVFCYSGFRRGSWAV